MGKAFAWLIGILVVLGAIGFGARRLASKLMSDRALTPKAIGTETPDSVGIPFTRLIVPSDDRTLIAWWVQAADSARTAPALLFLHGNRSAISDYPSLQRFLYRQGISSFVFDYSGFGASGGSASLENAIADAGRAARAFAEAAGPSARKVAMGSALGATVLLQAADSVQPHVDGLVLESVDASVRDAAVRTGRLPRFVARVVEDIGDNVSAARRIRLPTLAVHSQADERVPFDEAERVIAAIPGRAALVRHRRPGHSAILTSSRPCDWAAVLAFVKAGTLPAARLDTTDACAQPEPAQASPSTRTDSATRSDSTTRADSGTRAGSGAARR